MSADLPFLCGDCTPRHLRVPSGTALVHPNGAIGIATLMVAVADLIVSSTRYQALLDQPPHQSDGHAGGTRSAHWRVGDTELVLASPAHDDAEETTLKQLAGRGEGPYAFVVRVDHGEERSLDVGLTHGVRMSLVRV